MPIKTKILKQLNTVLLVRDMATGGGNTTLSAAAAAGATSITVGAITNFSAGDTLRIGTGEEMELGVVSGAPTGSTITLNEPLVYSHIIGEAVVEQVAYDLGDISDGGVSLQVTGQMTDIPVATKRLTFTILDGFLDMMASFGLPTMTLNNLAIMFGIPFTKISGTGTVAAPWAFATDGTEFASEQNQSIIAIGTRGDGSTTRAELWGVDFDYTGLSATMSRGAAVNLPVKAVASAGGVLNDNASPYVANTSIRPTKGKVFDYLAEVGLFLDETSGTPVNTTSSGTNAAGQNVLNVASGTGVTSGMWLRIDTGSTSEYHRVSSVSVNAITLADNLLRAIAAGVAVVQQKLVPFAGVDSKGVTFSAAGNMDKIQVATRRLIAGLKPGDAKVTLSFSVMDVSLVNFAYALGIPQSAIASGRLPINSNVGTYDIPGLYLKGMTKDGYTNWITAWGCSQDISNINNVLNSKGIGVVPITVRPASAIGFMQHA